MTEEEKVAVPEADPQPEAEASPAPEVDAEETPDGDSQAEDQRADGEEGDGDEETPKPKRRRKPRPRPQERHIIRLEEKVRLLEERLSPAGQGGSTAGAPKEADPEPTQEDYQDFDKYVADRAAWTARKETRRLFDEEAGNRRQEQKAQARNTAQATYDTRCDEARGKYEDFDDIAFAEDVTITDTMALAIVDSETGPDVQYHLGNHPEEAERIARLTKVGQVRAIGSLEAKLASGSPQPVPVKTTSAPPPMKAIAGKGAAGGKVDPDKLSMNEWAKLHGKGKVTGMYKR